MLNVECGALGTASSERANQAVILSEAKDHLATLDQFKKILRFAQDDMPFRAFRFLRGSGEA